VSYFRRLFFEISVALVAGLLFLPGLLGAATAAVYFTGWPSEQGGDQVGMGIALGLAGWLFISVAFLRGLARPEIAHGGVYEQLCVRLRSLRGQMEGIDAGTSPLQPQGHSDSSREAYQIALEHKCRLESALLSESSDSQRPTPPREFTSGFRWWFAFGYINLWRDVHRAEEALLEVQAPDELYVAALQDEARLAKATIESRDVLAAELRTLIDARREYAAQDKRTSGGQSGKGLANKRLKRRRTSDGESGKTLPDPFAMPRARAVVRAVRYALNQRRNELWDRLVHLRMLVLFSMIATGIVTYGLLALAVIQGVEETAVTAGIAFYLVGALVGLFGELYGTSRRRRGIVEDYGLSSARLLTVPLLAGIAAVGGVLLTRLGGTATSDELPTLAEIFSLQKYPFGLVISAIFGLTPGLLLDRLSQQTEDYKSELAQTARAPEVPAD
jgi:hypothetical protein